MHYLLGYGAFLLGAFLYVLGKVQEYKEMAEANPDPKIVYNTGKFLLKEAVNFVRLLVGGVALIWFLPMLIGGATVDFKSVSGAVLTTVSLQTLLLPFYFVVGYGGNSALFSFFGKYKKTLLNQVGVESN